MDIKSQKCKKTIDIYLKLYYYVFATENIQKKNKSVRSTLKGQERG